MPLDRFDRLGADDAGALVLDGDAAANTLDGGADADTLSGRGGADTLNGMDGDDVLYGHSNGAQSAIVSTAVSSGMSIPVGGAFAPGDPGFLYIIEKDTGVIWRVDIATGARTTFLDIPQGEFTRDGERGALGVAFHPDYASNGRFFVYLTDAQGDVSVREYSRAAGSPPTANTTFSVVWEAPHPTFNNHNGGWIGFSPVDGYLYIAVGDGGSGGDPSNNAQNLDSFLGKLLRIDVDNGDDFPGDATRNYHIPATNPFVGVAGLDEIWAYGLRNPFRAGFDPRNGDLYIGDVGQSAREEVDWVPAGDGGFNFGWRIMEGNLPYNPGPPGTPQPGDPSLTNPIYDYPRSVGTVITGGDVYTGAVANFVGQYMFADFGSGRIFTLQVVNGVAVDAVQRNAQITGPAPTSITDFVTDSAGNLYALGYGGTLWLLTPGSGAEDVGDILDGGAGNDTLTGNAGADTLIGGSGFDTANYSVASSGASWVRDASGAWTVTAGVDGVDLTSSVERLHFADRDVYLDPAPQTFSGNGTSDILFQRNDAVVASWEITGAALTSSAVIGSPGAGWTLLSTGDFDGDGRDDILWRRNSDGVVYSWQMNGTAIASAGAITGLGAGWSFLGAGDMNGDGRDDLAWQRSDGLVYVWQMDGRTITSAGVAASLDSSWVFQTLADLNGDGRDDFVWRQGEQTYVWLMNGSAVASAGFTSAQALGAGWDIVGAADTNGDGREDLIWQDDSGLVAIWRMNGATVSSVAFVGSADPNDWAVRNIGDYNGDGRADILWQRDDGAIYVWLLNANGSIQQAGAVAGVGPEWGVI
ncbi:PQQ-dependent sugar dehydrogenase [Terricaulis sp.]|uniref:PQQ-dependent sugar dehydrogenase n=1 Tax=Terricaulis sp. TaxID=2768686 RepID=UPI00378449EA